LLQRSLHSYRYRPVGSAVAFNGDAEQFGVDVAPRRGTAFATSGARGIVWRFLEKLLPASAMATLRVGID
jgi:hypothetical protein